MISIIKNTILAVFLLLFFNSCNKDSNKLSEKEQSLLYQSYHGYTLPIDSFNTLNDALVYMDDIYCLKKEDLWPIAYLDMKTHQLLSKPNRNTVKIGLEPTPCIDTMIEFDPKMILEIVKDGHNTHIEGEFTEVDSIPKYVKKQMLSFGDDPNYAIGALGNGIWICTNKDDKFKNLYPYIYESVVGFIESARKYSQMAYNKSIDELTEQEFEEFSKEFSFHLSFKYTDEEASIKLDY
jgi:hypothetical protein